MTNLRKFTVFHWP